MEDSEKRDAYLRVASSRQMLKFFLTELYRRIYIYKTRKLSLSLWQEIPDWSKFWRGRGLEIAECSWTFDFANVVLVI